MPHLHQTLHARAACQADLDIFAALADAPRHTNLDDLICRVSIANHQLSSLAIMTPSEHTLIIDTLHHIPPHTPRHRDLDVLVFNFARARGFSRILEVLELGAPPSHYSPDAWVQQIHAGSILHQDLTWRLEQGAYIKQFDITSVSLEWQLS